MKGFKLLPILFCAALVAADQLSKYIAYILLEPVGSVTIINGVFNLSYVVNDGAGFGILQGVQGARYFFILVTVVVMAGIIYYYVKLPKDKMYNKARFTLILIMAGALGNFIDRVRVGYVIDFIEARFIKFPVFNIADSYVVIGVIFFSVLYLFVYKENKIEGRQAEPERL